MTLSFRARLALAMGALILLVAAAFALWVPRRFEKEAVALIGHKAETLAHLTAFTIHPSLYFGDRAALEEALSGTREDEDVAYIVVADPAGKRLAAFHPERASRGGIARRTPGGGLSPDGRLFEVTTPVREGERVLAFLHIGLSLERLNRELLQMRIAIALLSAVILAIGLAIVMLTSNLLTRPLQAVAAGAARVAAGDLGHRVPAEGRADEIGRLAASFNDMAEKVSERDAALRRSHEQLRLLSRRLLSVQEEERLRIAREVHDELGQALTAMKIELQQIGVRDESLREPLRAISRSIDEVVDLVRRIAADLRPAILDDLGISAAIEQQLRRLRETAGIRTELAIAEEPQVDVLTGATLYRITKEALANVVRHAEATDVKVSLAVVDGAAILEIRDNGRGIDGRSIADPRSLGLVGMRERAEMLGGSAMIEGAPGGGTTVRVTLPLAREERSAGTLR
ncbi:MAG TPA: HAMP domain-containing protein [Thermoanaerobaculia bacterium]|nr:HAMP domain-containing protein [Thermoanaerobaculia bacterium]